MLADDLHSALAASNLNGHGTVFVTRDGDLVMPGRMISGGSAEDSHAAVDLAAIEAETRELARAEEEHRTRVGQFAAVRAERERADSALEQGRAGRAKRSESQSSVAALSLVPSSLSRSPKPTAATRAGVSASWRNS